MGPPSKKGQAAGQVVELFTKYQLSPPVDNPVDSLSPPSNDLLWFPALKVSGLCRVLETERLWIKEDCQPTGRRPRSRIMSSDHGRLLKEWMFSTPPPLLPKAKKWSRWLNSLPTKGFRLSPPVDNPVDPLSRLFHGFLGHLNPVNPSDMRPASKGRV